MSNLSNPNGARTMPEMAAGEPVFSSGGGILARLSSSDPMEARY